MFENLSDENPIDVTSTFTGTVWQVKFCGEATILPTSVTKH